MATTIPPTDPEVPFGYCHCGCGQRTSIIKGTNSKLGLVAGQSYRFLRGHRARLPQFRATGPRPGALGHFWEQVRFEDGPLPTPCWVWTGVRHKNGYGRVRLAGRTEYTHRLAFEEAFGPIPGRAQIDHHCDQKACIAPHHLFLGSHKINARDAASKGRLARKLRPGNILEMRDLHRAGWALPALARKFGIAPESVKRIVATRTTWHHLTSADWQPAPMRCKRGHVYDGHKKIDRLGRQMPSCSTCQPAARERRLAYFRDYNTRRPGAPQAQGRPKRTLGGEQNPNARLTRAQALQVLGK